jgi:outer membrane protein assembly factor BamB
MNGVRVPLFAITLLLVTAPAGAGPLLADDSNLQAAGLMAYWQAQLPLANGDELKAVHRVDDVLYAVTRNGTLFSVTAETGLVRWGAKLTVREFEIFRPAHNLGRPETGPVVITTSNEIYLLDRLKGTEIQRFAPAFAIGGAAIAAEDVLYIGSQDGHARAFQLTSRTGLAPLQLWVVGTQGAISTSPAFHDLQTLILASHGGYVFSCRTGNKVLNWATRAGEKIVADPAVDATGVYIAGMDRSLYKLNAATGKQVWRVRFPEPLRTGPSVSGETLFQFCENQGMSALESATGRELWRHPGGVSLAAVTSNGVALLTPAGHIDFVDDITGNVVQTMVSDAVAGAVTNLTDHVIYLFGRDGRILCLQPDETPYLRRQQIIAAKRLLDKHESKAPGATAGEESSAKSATPGDPFRSRNDRP